MFAYVDETGNTGAKLLDEDQPLFITAALLTRSDFDGRFGQEVKAVAHSIGVDEIHATKLGLGRLEDVAGALLKILRKAGPAFAISRVEKRYVLATKVFDTLFDSHENKSVPWHVYNVGPLRILMAFKIASLLDEVIALEFWDALLDKQSDRARTKMAGFCRALRGRVDLLPDQRSRKIAGEALDWAAANPESLDFVHQTKITGKGHLPNMIGFGNLLGGIERQSSVWNRQVDLIKHDRQHEFAAAIKFWHEMYSNARPEAVVMPLGQKFVLRKVFGSKLEISSAAESAGIQMIDVILWLFNRSLRDELPERCQALMEYVYGRAHQDDFSFIGVQAETEKVLAAIEDEPLTPQAIEDGRALQTQFEERRIRAMSDYALTKQAEARSTVGDVKTPMPPRRPS